MDDIDRRLLELLHEDANRPLKVLGAAVNLARSSVRDRIARLEARGIIRRYTIETDRSEDALTAVLLVRLARTPSPDVVRDIVSLAAVFRCRSLSGDIDLLVEIAGANVAAINCARDRIAGIAGVVDVETSFVLKQEKAPP